MITDMHLWTEVRRAVLAGGMSRREAAEKFKLNFRTIQKILAHEEPPGYRRTETREKPTIGPFIPIIHAILEADKKSHRKQRHTGRKLFERLRDEHGYTGGITVVRDEIRRYKQRSAEVFMPLSHPPGCAQFDFGQARAVYRGRPIKVMFCVMSLPHSDAIFCQAFPRESATTTRRSRWPGSSADAARRRPTSSSACNRTIFTTITSAWSVARTRRGMSRIS